MEGFTLTKRESGKDGAMRFTHSTWTDARGMEIGESLSTLAGRTLKSYTYRIPGSPCAHGIFLTAEKALAQGNRVLDHLASVGLSPVKAVAV